VKRLRLAQVSYKHSNIFLILGEIEFGELSMVDTTGSGDFCSLISIGPFGELHDRLHLGIFRIK
jgi:hypothetical protein